MAEEKETKSKELAIRFAEITKHNVGQVRALNAALIPVQYSDAFYKSISSKWPEDNPLIVLGFHNDALVGALCGRDATELNEHSQLHLPEDFIASHSISSSSSTSTGHDTGSHAGGKKHKGKGGKDKEKEAKKKTVYIATLGVLAPYRRRGIATKLVKKLLENVESLGTVDYVYLHTPTTHTEAETFYNKLGFVKAYEVKDYYTNQEFKDASVLVYTCSQKE